jgi:hypothetical protein
MACHFVTALKVPGLGRTKQTIHGSIPGANQQPDAAQGRNEFAPDDGEGLDEFHEAFDVDTGMEVEASPDDTEAMLAAADISFDTGDVVGKLMAFIAQLRSSSEDVREYLAQLASAQGCPEWEIKLWVRTRWGSLSDCFRTALALQKVCNSCMRFSC